MLSPWRISLLLLMLMLMCCVSLSSYKRCARYCSCKGSSMKCIGSKCPKGIIPKPPINVTSVELSDFVLDNITREMGSNLTSAKVASLFFNEGNIRSVSPDAFHDLKYLKRFKWIQKKISRENVYNVVSSLNKQLERFEVQATTSNLQTLNAYIFVKFPRMTHLKLGFRYLKDFNSNALSHLLMLSSLDLSGNRLSTIKMDSVISNLTELKISKNDFVEFPPICNKTVKLPQLRSLYIGDNAIRVLDVSNLACLKNFLKLTLSGNRIDIIPDNSFAKLMNLESLYMDGLPVRTIEPLAFNSSSLSKLVFTDIPSLSRKNFDPVTLFKNTPNLKILNMMNTKLDIRLSYFRKLLLPLKNITSLNFQRSKIKGLPLDLFSELTQLKSIVLSGNYISNWRKEVFENVTSLKELVLDGCNIKMITEESFPLEFRLKVKEINLSDNPFICTCDLMWFRNWIREARANKSITFTKFPYRYECRSPNTERLSLKDYNPTVKSCTPLPWYVIFLPILFGSLLIVCVSGVVAYRYRWYLFYWLSLLRRRRQRQYMTPRELKYDAFVSYSNEDSDWVYDELLHYLEGQIGLRLCEHSRDFEGGKLIVDNVFDALDTSNKTILVLSNDYMKSDWCQFELQMALNSFYKHETDLVVVMLEQIRPRHVTSSLRALMTSTTYIEWPPDDQTRDLFRERLKHSVVN